MAKPSDEDMALDLVANINVQEGMNHLSTHQARKRKDPPEQMEQDETSNICHKEHHLVAFLCGFVCTKCNTGVGSSLFGTLTDKVIKHHFTTHKCYSGLGTPKYTQIVKDLTIAQKALHESVKSNPSLALDLISKTFPPNHTQSIPKACYCQNCGHWDTKPSRMNNHFNQSNVSRNKYKCHHHLHQSEGVICKGLFDLHCPQAILKSIVNGTFKLPLHKSDQSKTPQLLMCSTPSLLEYTPVSSNSESISNNISTATSSEHESQSPNVSHEKLCFKSSEEQLQCALSELNIACNDNQRINTVLRACFVNKSSTKQQAEVELEHAKKYLMILTKAIDCIDNPNDSIAQFRQLSMDSTTPFNSFTDSPIIQIIIKSGIKWLESGAANRDVNRIDPCMRGRLYHVGVPESPDVEKLLHGANFTTSNNFDKIIDQWTHITLFLSRRFAPLIKDQVAEAQIIYNHFIEKYATEKEAQESTIDAIMDTSIICGIILTAVLEEPCTPRTLTAIEKFHVGRTIITNSRMSHLQFRSANSLCEYNMHRMHPIDTCPL
jgi:hypothetical protein